MDKSLLMFRGGVRSVTRVLADNNEHTLYYKAKTPNELAAHIGAESAILGETAEGAVARQKMRAKFIASALCTETGERLMTEQEAEMIPGSLKSQICSFIITGSNEIGDAGKD